MNNAQPSSKWLSLIRTSYSIFDDKYQEANKKSRLFGYERHKRKLTT
jgi:hypothetical protein